MKWQQNTHPTTHLPRVHSNPHTLVRILIILQVFTSRLFFLRPDLLVIFCGTQVERPQRGLYD